MQPMKTVQDVEYVEASAGEVYAPNSKLIPCTSRFVSVAAYEWALRHCEKPTYVDMSEPVRVVLTFHDRSTLTDHGNRMGASGGTPREQAERMCALAVAKNWTGIEFNGSPDFLRVASRKRYGSICPFTCRTTSSARYWQKWKPCGIRRNRSHARPLLPNSIPAQGNRFHLRAFAPGDFQRRNGVLSFLGVGQC